MAEQRLTLITGRSARQGTGISTGKDKTEYRKAIRVIELNRSDMARAGLKDGDPVTLSTQFGRAEARCRQGDIPEGLAFMAFGPVCNRLIGGETSASGMPDSKHVEVDLKGV